MTIRELLNQPVDPLDAEVLLAHVLKKSKEYVIVRSDNYVNSKLAKKYLSLVARRIKGWPVAYLTGHKEFYGLDFLVTKEVLIPRPETEGLVDLVLSRITDHGSRIKILDIGTGSGNIIISLASTLAPIARSGNLPLRFKNRPLRSNLIQDRHATADAETSVLKAVARDGFRFFASDISPKALAVAKRNARRHKTRISFIQSDILGALKNKHFDIIVANLPYLTKRTDPSTKFEPTSALIAKQKGLALIEKLFKQVSTLHPLPSTLFLEIGHDQAATIKKLAAKWLPASPAGGPAYETKISKDLAGKNRYALFFQKSS